MNMHVQRQDDPSRWNERLVCSATKITCRIVGLFEFVFVDKELLIVERFRKQVEASQLGEDSYTACNRDTYNIDTNTGTTNINIREEVQNSYAKRKHEQREIVC